MELLVVVAVLMVVVAIALPRLLAARKTAQQATAAAFLRNLNVAQTQHYIVRAQYSGNFLELEINYARLERELPNLREQLGIGVRPVSNHNLPTLAFLLLPALQDNAYATGGSPRPGGQDSASGGGGPGTPDAGSGSGSGGGKPAAGDEPSSGVENGGGAGGSGGGSGPGSNSSGGGSDAPDESAVRDRMVWQGYEFLLERPTPHTWRCWANPLRDDRGASYYFIDQTGTVRQEFGRPASANSNPLP